MRFFETIQSIDFSSIGSTNILPLDISDAIIKEKISLMLFAGVLTKESVKPVLKYSELEHPSNVTGLNGTQELFYTVQKNNKQYGLSISDPRCFDYHQVMSHKADYGDLYGSDPMCKSIKPGASFEEISLFDAVRCFSDYPDSIRIEELLAFFHIGDKAYSPFKLGTTFCPQQFPDILPVNPNADSTLFGKFQHDLGTWYKACFPRRYLRHFIVQKPDLYKNRPVNDLKFDKESVQIDIPMPIFYRPLGPMVYDMRIDNSLREIRFYRLFLNPNGCGLREALVPVISLQENGYYHKVMTSLPNIDHMPLWNVRRINFPGTDTVVLCGCIQDAEALQRDNEGTKNVAFTSFVDVGDNLELIDFSPLDKKNIIFLVTNHNGGSLENAYEEVAKTYDFIKKTNIKIKDCAFVQREVQYPDSTLTIATPEALASAYYHTPPKITPKSLIPPMDETEFFTMLAKIRKEREAPPFWAPAEQELVKENPAKGILIRSLLYRNAITVLAGPPSAGKSRFCRSLIRYLVKGNDKRYMKERFWTRCCAGSTMKILYWNFDCIPDLESWKETCLHGLNEDQKRNIFIEDAPFEEEFFNSFSGRPEVEAYRRKIAKYTYKGTPGHPLDLLIVDTLVSVWNKKNIEGSLRFLNLLMKTMPGMAVLAIHHTTELGKPLGGGDPKRMPRIVMTMERINRTVDYTPSKTTTAKSFKDADKRSNKKKTATFFYEFRYDKFSTSHADIEDIPFYCIREDEDMYSVYKPICTRDEMFSSLVYHYRNNDDTHPTNKVIGAMLGYSNREVQKKMIDEKKYFSILNKAKRTASSNDELLPNRKRVKE